MTARIVGLDGRALPPSARALVTPADIHQTARSLWLSRTIDTDCFNLACFVAANAQAGDGRTAWITHEAAHSICVSMGGHLLAGPVSSQRGDYIQALQDTHRILKMHNHIDQTALDAPDVGERHWTRNPDPIEDLSTRRVYFRLPDMTRNDYAAYIHELHQKDMKRLHGAISLSLR